MLIKASYLLKDFKQSYYSKLPKSTWKQRDSAKKSVTFFNKVVNDFNDLIADCIVEEGKQQTPRLGTLAIHKKLPSMIQQANKEFSGYAIDYNASKREGKKCYHLNAHSQGCVMVLHWSASPGLCGDVRVGYFFKGARRLTRQKMGPKIKAGFTDYPIIKHVK